MHPLPYKDLFTQLLINIQKYERLIWMASSVFVCTLAYAVSILRLFIVGSELPNPLEESEEKIKTLGDLMDSRQSHN